VANAVGQGGSNCATAAQLKSPMMAWALAVAFTSMLPTIRELTAHLQVAAFLAMPHRLPSACLDYRQQLL
jgi:hypothetical protein